jgi:MFS superfamily sulfate permease-like transporter
VTAGVLIAAGLLRLGAVSDLVSKPVMTGFLFGLGMTITIGQLPAVLGVPEGTGNFFPRLWDLLSQSSAASTPRRWPLDWLDRRAAARPATATGLPSTVLVLGVLQRLIVAAGLSLVYVVKRLSRPSVGVLARDPATGVGPTVTRAGRPPTTFWSWRAAARSSTRTPSR